MKGKTDQNVRVKIKNNTSPEIGQDIMVSNTACYYGQVWDIGNS